MAWTKGDVDKVARWAKKYTSKDRGQTTMRKYVDKVRLFFLSFFLSFRSRLRPRSSADPFRSCFFFLLSLSLSVRSLAVSFSAPQGRLPCSISPVRLLKVPIARSGILCLFVKGQGRRVVVGCAEGEEEGRRCRGVGRGGGDFGGWEEEGGEGWEEVEEEEEVSLYSVSLGLDGERRERKRRSSRD